MKSAIKVDGLRKSYGTTEALKGVSLDVRPGELFGFIGPDGAGKTSLFRILATLLRQDRGTARVLDLDCTADYRSLRSRIGYMPGRFALYPDLSVEENIEFYSALYSTSLKDGLEVVAPVWRQIEPFRKRRAGKLSGGMKQKLALCCALVHSPDVLLLDEPTTGVDAVSRQEFWDLLATLRERGITTVVSTPYMDEASRCSRVALINGGSILDQGVPEELVKKHNCKDIGEVFLKLITASESNNVTEDGRGRPSQSNVNAIEVKDLTKRFGDFIAVNNISFQVKKGEIFGFLGANGAGKTTAIRMLSGLSVPTSGSGTVAGCDIMTQPEAIKKRIGYMSQKFSLYDDLTVWENIRFFGSLYGMPGRRIDECGHEILDRLDFLDRRNTLVGSIPPGWKQKLAFSVAMLHEPEIVFLDEPTGGVDPVARRQLWDLIRDAAAKGVTIFVTTHYMDEAELCDRVSIMVDGRIAALGTPEKLKKDYNAASLDEVFRALARPASTLNPITL